MTLGDIRTSCQENAAGTLLGVNGGSRKEVEYRHSLQALEEYFLIEISVLPMHQGLGIFDS